MPAHGQTRYAVRPGEDEHLRHPGHASARRPRTNGPGRCNEWVKFGEHVFMSHNEVPDENGKLHRDPIRIDDITKPERLQEADRQPAVLDPALGRPDELSLLEGAVPGRADRRGGVRARQLFYQGTMAYKTGDFPKAARQIQEGPGGLEGWPSTTSPTYRDDDLCKKETGLIVKRYLVRAQAARGPDARRHAVQGDRRPSPRTTRRSTRSTRSR